MKKLFIIFFAFVLILPARAETEFNYNGYIAHQYSVLNQNPASIIPAANTEQTKLYLDASYTADNWTIKLKPELTYNHLGIYKDITTLNILENNISYNTDNWSITAGKKILGWGQSILWSPANIIDININPTNGLTQQPGSTLLNLHLKDKSGNNFDFVYKPKLSVTDPTFNYFTGTAPDAFTFRLSDTIGQNDYAVSFNYLNPYTVVGLEYASTLDNGFVIYSENTIKQTNQIILDSLNGFKYDLSSDINLNMEYFYNGDGVMPAQYALVFLANNYQFVNLSKNYLFTHLSYAKIDDKSKYNLMVINNLDDGSGIVRLGYTYDFSSNINAGLDYNIFYGDKNSEFGHLPALSAWVFTLKYYL